jgi:hypothetical protein
VKKFSVSLTACALVVGLAAIGLAAAGDAKAPSTITGYVTDSHCKDMGAKEGHKDCAVKCAHEKGAKLGVWDAASSKFYTLDDQKKAEEFAGMNVTVTGTVDGENLKVATIAKAEAKPPEKK